MITKMAFAASKVFPGHPDISVSLRWMNGVRGGVELIQKWLPAALLRRYGVGALKVRQSRLNVENGAAYLSNGCVNCDALQAQYFVEELSEDAEEFALSVDVSFDRGFADQFSKSDSYIFRWWFDERGGAGGTETPAFSDKSS